MGLKELKQNMKIEIGYDIIEVWDNGVEYDLIMWKYNRVLGQKWVVKVIKGDEVLEYVN